MTRSSVGLGVDGRPCLWATEQSGSGGGWKDCQRNVFLELSCVGKRPSSSSPDSCNNSSEHFTQW